MIIWTIFCFIAIFVMVLIGYFTYTSKRVTDYFKYLRTTYSRFSIITSTLYVILGILVALFTDLTDFSQLGTSEKMTEEYTLLKKDIGILYHMPNLEEQVSLVNRLELVFHQLAPPNNNKNYAFLLLLMLTLGSFVALITADKKTSFLLEEELKNIKKSNSNFTSKMNVMLMNTARISKLVQLKCDRISKISRQTQTQTNEQNKKCAVCKDTFSSNKQIENICNLIISYVKEICDTDPEANMRGALFLPDSDEKRLELVYSCDCMDNENIINSPNEIYKTHFDLNVSNPGSFAVKTFYAPNSLVIQDCISNNGFNFFYENQKEHLKGIIGIPIKHFNKTIAVITLDTNKIDYFSGGELLDHALKLFSHEIGIRLKYELLIKDYFKYLLN